MTTHERAEMLRKKLASMGIRSDAELDEALKATRMDVAIFVEPASNEKTA